MRKIGNDEISKLAEDYADYWVVINDKQLWMKIRSAYRAGFFAALKIANEKNPKGGSPKQILKTMHTDNAD